jgi:hypothetical protein
MKSHIVGWTSRFSRGPCPCGSGIPAHKCCWRGMGRWEKSTVGIIEPPETNFMHERCYLASLGNCGPKMTREHFISRNILERITASTLKFENAEHFFGGKATVEIGVDAFSSKNSLRQSQLGAVGPGYRRWLCILHNRNFGRKCRAGGHHPSTPKIVSYRLRPRYGTLDVEGILWSDCRWKNTNVIWKYFIERSPRGLAPPSADG